ncbi:MAG: hypothetical protein LBH70_09370 [Spirochaetaceae bacterium]|jgi:uncharacterized integral membrane protein|nr:hypothetical protein [Spirochaetaceae bacterium]
MPWRLIGFVLLFGILLVFITLNLGNTCNISFGFKTISDVPVFLTVFCAFAVGLLCAIPLSFSVRQRKKAKPGKLFSPKGARKSGKKNKGAVPGEETPEVSSYQDESSYGID